MPNVERLKRLVDILDNTHPSEFDLEHWVSSCGTVACAVGWACGDPHFYAQGLRLVDGTPEYTSPEGEWFRSWDAVEKFFDLTEDQAVWLFASVSYPAYGWQDPQAVRDRILELING